jgi:hypothetical protein
MSIADILGHHHHDPPISDLELAAIDTMAHLVIGHIEAGHGQDNPALMTDLGTLRADIDKVLGPEEDAELRLLRQISAAVIEIASTQEDLLDGQADIIAPILALVDAVEPISTMAYQVDALYRYLLPGPSGVIAYAYQGYGFEHFIQKGRTPPMPVSIKDTDLVWGVAVGSLKDAAGEPVDLASVSVALNVADPTLLTLVDNGGGTGTFVFAGTASYPAPLPASSALNAVVTNADGTSFTISDVITVVASDAVTGEFVFTPPA